MNFDRDVLPLFNQQFGSVITLKGLLLLNVVSKLKGQNSCFDAEMWKNYVRRYPRGKQ